MEIKNPVSDNFTRDKFGADRGVKIICHVFPLSAHAAQHTSLLSVQFSALLPRFVHFTAFYFGLVLSPPLSCHWLSSSWKEYPDTKEDNA